MAPRSHRAGGWTSSPTASRSHRRIRIAPGGDVFIAETARGRIRVLRAKDGATRAEQRWTFADGLDEPFGMAFYPPGPAPQWLVVAETDRVVRYPYRDGDTASRGRPEVVVAQLAPTSGGHFSRDIAFAPDGKRFFVAVGSNGNIAEDLTKKSPAEIATWEGEHGLGAAWDKETRRAAVLVFDTANPGTGKNFANGIRNCVSLAVHPRSGDVWCSTNERDNLGDDLVPDYITRVGAGKFYGWPWYYLGDNEDPRMAGNALTSRARSRCRTCCSPRIRRRSA